MVRFIYATLKADTGAGGVNTLLGGRIYPGRVPQSAALPAAAIALVSSVPLNTMSGRRVLKNTLVDVKLICEGIDLGPLVPIADRIDAVLQGAKGLQDGANVVKLVLDAENEIDGDEGGNAYMQQIQTYRTSVYATP